MRKIDLSGGGFGRWTVIGPREIIGRQSYWPCRCECGAKKMVYQGNLTTGKSLSCGCLSVELAKARFTKHNGARGGKVLPEYRSWQHMKDRCLNPRNKAYGRYGGRGIRVHEEWVTDFDAFFRHVGPRPSPKHSIDRIENNAGYMPGNVRWATDLEQVRNRRNTRRAADGAMIFDMRKKAGVSSTTYARRVRAGWNQEEAATTPAREKLPNGQGRRFGKH